MVHRVLPLFGCYQKVRHHHENDIHKLERRVSVVHAQWDVKKRYKKRGKVKSFLKRRRFAAGSTGLPEQGGIQQRLIDGRDQEPITLHLTTSVCTRRGTDWHHVVRRVVFNHIIK